MSPHPPESKLPDPPRLADRGRLVLVLALGLVFWGYTTPDMQIHWENLALSAVFDARTQTSRGARGILRPGLLSPPRALAAGAHAGRTAFLS